MRKVLGRCSLFLLVSLLLTGCSSSPRYRSIIDSVHEKPYRVYGRVLDSFERPVVNCKIVLIKRKIVTVDMPEPHEPPEIVETLSELPVAITDSTGDYSLMFEPLGANDLWLYFDAENQGYTPRFVDITPLMGATVFQAEGNSPVNVSIVLEDSLGASKYNEKRGAEGRGSRPK